MDDLVIATNIQKMVFWYYQKEREVYKEGGIYMNYVLMNHKSNNGMGEKQAREWAECLNEKEFVSVLDIKDMKEFFDNLNEEDVVYLSGGDGTLNHFANDLYGYTPKNQIYYVKSGSGNDFYHDSEDDVVDGIISLNKYLTNLPVVTINGVERRFLNGIGYGIDGETCYQGDVIRATSDKPVNYSNIAIKLLLFNYKPHKATITVDGKVSKFTDVWFASTMKGRYYGGGMMVAPAQNRFNEAGTVSVVCVHKRDRIGTLLRFKSLFTGDHVKKADWCQVFEGKEVKVEFEAPCAIQVDGEVIPNVTSYTVRA